MAQAMDDARDEDENHPRQIEHGPGQEPVERFPCRRAVSTQFAGPNEGVIFRAKGVSGLPSQAGPTPFFALAFVGVATFFIRWDHNRQSTRSMRQPASISRSRSAGVSCQGDRLVAHQGSRVHLSIPARSLWNGWEKTNRESVWLRKTNQRSPAATS
jgi:hypothetical protein